MLHVLQLVNFCVKQVKFFIISLFPLCSLQLDSAETTTTFPHYRMRPLNVCETEYCLVQK